MLMSKRQKIISKLTTYIVLTLLTIFCMFPFLWMLNTALKPSGEIRSVNPTFWINNPTLEHFINVLTNTMFLTYFKNSIIVALFATVCAMLISIFSAYALSRFMRYRGIKIFSIAMLLSQMVPPVLLLIPLYITMMNLNLLNTHYSLILAYTTFTVPLCTFMLTSFFASIPVELEEAAEIDGATRIGIIMRVILPISVPGLISTSLFAFINAWNEFMFGYVFVTDEAVRTLTPGIMLFQGLYTTDWGSLMAASVMSVIPVVIMFIYLQRYLIEGITAGSVKG